MHITTPAIFLSPHFDDVPLSCGGTVAMLAAAGSPPLVVTVFGGEVTDEVLTEFALWKHSRWSAVTIDDALQQRRREEKAASAILGCRTRSLGVPDAIYRGARYLSDAELYQGEIVKEEAPLVRLLAEEVRALPEWAPDATVFVPLGVGGHVDHRLLFDVGRSLAVPPTSVLAYEDCPYAIHTPVGLAERLKQLGGLVGGQITVPIGLSLGRRLDAIAAYESQVPVIFRFTDDFRAAVSGHALAVGGGVAAERYWPVLG